MPSSLRACSSTMSRPSRRSCTSEARRALACSACSLAASCASICRCIPLTSGTLPRPSHSWACSPASSASKMGGATRGGRARVGGGGGGRGGGLCVGGVGGEGDVGNGGVLGRARAVRDHGGVAGALGHFYRGKGFGQRADLVDLDQDRVGDALVYALLEEPGVGHEQVVAHQLHLVAQALAQLLPAVLVAFVHAVFDADDGVFVNPGGQHVDPLGGAELQAAFAVQHVQAVLAELAGCAVQPQCDLLAGAVAGGGDGLQDQADGRFVVFHARGKAAFVAHGGAHAQVVDDFLERMEYLGAPAQRLAKV